MRKFKKIIIKYTFFLYSTFHFASPDLFFDQSRFCLIRQEEVVNQKKEKIAILNFFQGLTFGKVMTENFSGKIRILVPHFDNLHCIDLNKKEDENDFSFENIFYQVIKEKIAEFKINCDLTKDDLQKIEVKIEEIREKEEIRENAKKEKEEFESKMANNKEHEYYDKWEDKLNEMKKRLKGYIKEELKLKISLEEIRSDFSIEYIKNMLDYIKRRCDIIDSEYKEYKEEIKDVEFKLKEFKNKKKIEKLKIKYNEIEEAIEEIEKDLKDLHKKGEDTKKKLLKKQMELRSAFKFFKVLLEKISDNLLTKLTQAEFILVQEEVKIKLELNKVIRNIVYSINRQEGHLELIGEAITNIAGLQKAYIDYREKSEDKLEIIHAICYYNEKSILLFENCLVQFLSEFNSIIENIFKQKTELEKEIILHNIINNTIKEEHLISIDQNQSNLLTIEIKKASYFHFLKNLDRNIVNMFWKNCTKALFNIDQILQDFETSLYKRIIRGIDIVNNLFIKKNL